MKLYTDCRAKTVIPHPMSDLKARFDAQRAAFRRQPYPDASERRANLNRLEKAVRANQDALAAAINTDFGCRCRTEVLFSEIYTTLNSIRHAKSNVGQWMDRRHREIAWPLQPATAWVLPQPLGVVGIISAWNYPLFVSIPPLAGALAAGNRAMLKPSEYTPATSELLECMLAEAFPQDLVTVVTGDAEIGRTFTELPFDHLLFTGSTAVGRAVMRAAAENLTPVTLELGGKSPALIAPDASLRRAAEDIAYGKLLNAGQTCIAPDYVLVPRELAARFTEYLRAAIQQYYPEGAASAQYTSVINERHLARLRSYVDEARTRGTEVIEIGGSAPAERKFAPTLIIDPPEDTRVMQDEIFGPILPIKSYDSIDNATGYINDHPRPLALYLFSTSRKTIDRVLKQTISGGVTVNDTLLHIAADELPFGGIGPSGTGHYHGREGFDTFSKLKPIFSRRFPGLSRSLRPPYGRMHELLRRILIG